MLAKDIMVPITVCIKPKSTIKESIQLFRQTKLDGIPVVDSYNRLIGMFTRSNLYDCLLSGLSVDESVAGHFIEDIIYFKEDVEFNNLSELNQWLRNVRIGQTPVVDLNGQPIGMITQVIIVNFLLDRMESIFQKNNRDIELSQPNITLKHKEQSEELYKVNGTKYAIQSIIGKSNAIEEVKRLALLAAKSSSTVLITGECGTGKELFAQTIHNASDRWAKPFVNINCAAIPSELAESELFGYEGGAFTGASKHGKPGKFELADKSSIFLDEIGDMPLPLQGKLLRTIQEKEVIRVGGLQHKKVDVRIIAATNQDLIKLAHEGKFRKDLYYRLSVLSLNIPSLRNHLEDIPLLVNYFVKKYSLLLNKQIKGVSDKALNFLVNYHWPGNIRELENMIERAIIFCKGKIIDLGDLGIYQPNEGGESICSLSSIEKENIFKALEITQGNKAKAAKLLGISRSALYNKLKDS